MPDSLDLATAIALLVSAATLLWCIRKRRIHRALAATVSERLETQLGWSPEATRVLRGRERVAFGILCAAFPECLVFAQVPVARFIEVPSRNPRAEWMRRLGSQCVDFAICDQSSRVICVVELRPPASAMVAGLIRRLDRVGRTLGAVHIPVHVWGEAALPTPEFARSSIAAQWVRSTDAAPTHDVRTLDR